MIRGNHLVRLGRTELQVSPICYGSWQLSPNFWGPQPEDVIIQAMQRAFDVGVNFYDTADAYGEGLAERIMGRALADLPRDRIVVATKVFHHFNDKGQRYPDLSHDYILAECDASLTRLKMDYVDLYQCHSFDPLADPAEIAAAMEKLLKQGKIRAYGTSNWNAEQMRMGNVFGNFATCQPPYSLMNRKNEADVLPYCRATDTGVLVYSPLHKGLLSGKYKGTETFNDNRKNNANFKGEQFQRLADRVAQVGLIARGYNLTTVQLVLAATLMHPAITCAIVGIKTPEQIEEAAGAMGKTISREDYHAVRKLLNVTS